MTSLRSISRAMFLAYRRDRSAIFFTIGFPLMFLVLFGGIFKGATTSKVSVLEVGPVPILDSLNGDAKVQIDKLLKITKTSDLSAAQDKVRKGDSDSAVTQQGNQVSLYYSAADQVKSSTVRSVMEALVQATAGQPLDTLSTQQVEDKSLKTIQYYTPGLLGWALATGGTAGAALTFVNWRRKQLLRRLRLAPVGTGTLLAARLVVSIGIALVQTAIFIGVALLPYFGLKLSGQWWMAIPLVMAGTLAFLSLGLVIGAFAKTDDSAQGIVQLVVLPMAFLSGSFFPLDAAPAWLQTLSKLLPLRYLVESMRDVMVRGKDAVSVLPTLGGLLLFAAVLTLLASRLFRWDRV
ncbi:MAG TPA: ABC transporter permease [Rugosimonospora sp.]|nr:ABC transporter permease [Rugosimonospora sp.]